MSRINLKLKFWKGNYLPGGYDVGRPQEENLRENIQGQLDTKVENLKFNSVEDGWNNFGEPICEVAEGVLVKKVRTAARNISDKVLCLIERRRGLYKNYVSDRSYENKKDV